MLAPLEHLNGRLMEYLSIFHRSSSRESTQAPDDHQGASRQQPEMSGKRPAYGVEAEAVQVTKAKRIKSKARPGSSPYAASLKIGNRSTTSSVYSRDPDRPANPVANESDVEVLGHIQALPRNSRSTRPRVSSSPGHEKEQRRQQIEHETGLRRPGNQTGEGSSVRSNPSRFSARHSMRDEDEVPEPEENKEFPIQRTTREHRSAAPGSGRRSVGHGRKSERVSNSSPIRPSNWQEHIQVSSSEEEEKIEEQPQQRQLLSPDLPPPKLPPRSTQAAPATPVLSKKAKMRRKDGTLPSESGSSRRASLLAPKSGLPSSNVSVTPAAIDWAVVEAGNSNYVIHAQNVSLRQVGANKDHVLELVGNSGRRASLPLANVSGLQSNRGWFLRLELALEGNDADKLMALSCPFVAGDIAVDLAFPKEQGSQHLIDRAIDIIQNLSGLVADMLDNDAVATIAKLWEGAKRSSKAVKPVSELSKRAAAAAVRRAETSKGKGKMPLSPSQSRLSFPSDVQPRRSTRHSMTAAKPTVNTLSDDESPSTNRPQRRRSPHLDKHDLLFPYPFTGRSSLDITKDSLYRLMDDDFLNDVTLEFGLRYTVAEVSQQQEKALHLFNSFFYNKLSSRDAKPKTDNDKKWPAYDSVKKWTKSVDVFQKDFIIVPVNENLHWYLAVIVNPRALIETRPLPADERSPSHAASAKPSRSVSTSAESSREGKDPLDVMSEGEDEGVEHIKEKVEDCHISPQPKPIQSMELNWITNQDSMTFSSPPKTPSPPASSKPKFKREAIDLSDRSKTYIMTFDSLGGSHKAVGDNLKLWLEFEARDKLQKEIEPTAIEYVEAKVPQQNNFSDCGVFVIHFLRCLLNDTEKVLEFIGKPIPYAREKEVKEEYETEMNRVWHAATTKELRANWIEIIQQLNLKYQEMKGQGESQAAASVPGVEDSQASVVQINPPDRPEPLLTVGEGAEPSTTGSTSSTGGTTSSSSSSSSSSAAPPDTRQPSAARRQDSEVISRAASKGVSAEPQTEHPDPPTPTLPNNSLLSDSESEGGASREPSRMRSMSTKVSSREEIDSHVLVEDSQPKSDDESSDEPSVLFSSDRPEAETGDTIVPDTVHELSEDELATPIHLSGDQVPTAVLRTAQLSSTNSKRNSSNFGSSPVREPPSSPTTRSARKVKSSRKSAPDGYKQQTLLGYRVNGASSGPSSAAQDRPSTPEAKEPAVDPSAPSSRTRNHTYKGKKRAVSGPVVTGSERKRARSNTAGIEGQGSSSNNPIDLDPDSGSDGN